MVTVRRLYLYGVLAVVGLPLLMGMAGILRMLLENLFDAVGVTMLTSAPVDRESLGLSVALVLVGAPVWGVHAWLLRRSSGGGSTDVADESSCPSRATYFLIALLATLVVTLVGVSEALAGLIRYVALAQPAEGLPGAIADAAVFGTAWLLHVVWRGRDLRMAPARTAGDWSTRIYIYGMLFATAVIGLMSTAECLTIVAQEVSGMRPMFEGPRWWQDAIASPLAFAVTAAVAWLVHLGIAGRLVRAPAPMGDAHRASRSRVAYFLGMVLLSAFAVLLALTSSLEHLIAGVLGVWEPVEGSRFEADTYGPLLGILPFMAAWWFHLHRATLEALEFGGVSRRRSVARAGRLIVAFVGLAGLSFGVAWGIGASIDVSAALTETGVIPASILREDVALGVSAAIVGLAMWLPSWLGSQADRSRDPVADATSTARRSYLLLVSGVAVVAAMASLSWLVYQLIRVVLEAGAAEDSAWAVGTLLVAAVVLSTHLLALRSDLRISATQAAALTEPAAAAEAVEELLISGPPGADFEALNESIRSRLPRGYRVRVIPRAGSH